jgi:polyhydroxyalkanoate synthesis regulator phasin
LKDHQPKKSKPNIVKVISETPESERQDIEELEGMVHQLTTQVNEFKQHQQHYPERHTLSVGQSVAVVVDMNYVVDGMNSVEVGMNYVVVGMNSVEVGMNSVTHESEGQDIEELEGMVHQLTTQVNEFKQYQQQPQYYKSYEFCRGWYEFCCDWYELCCGWYELYPCCTCELLFHRLPLLSMYLLLL